MGDIFRVRVGLEYTNGGPGVNTFHFNSGIIFNSDAVDAAVGWLTSFYSTALRAQMPNNVTIRIPSFAETIVSSTGVVDGAENGTVPEVVLSGADSTNTSRATQYYVSLQTGTIRRRRRMRGGLFIGPATDSRINTDGSLQALAVTTINDSVSALISDSFTGGREWVIYGRPVLGAGGSVLETGVVGPVVGGVVKANPAVLRSRRD